MHEQLKHINIVYYYIWDLHKRNQIEIDFMLSQNIITDELIKFLSKQIFECFVEQLKLTVSESQ